MMGEPFLCRSKVQISGRRMHKYCMKYVVLLSTYRKGKLLSVDWEARTEEKRIDRKIAHLQVVTRILITLSYEIISY